MWTRRVAIPGAFIGRAREGHALDGLFDSGARLVTIAGVGGVGKTRLAVEWTRRALRRAGLADPIVCELADARDLDEACGVIARALATPLAAGATTEQAIHQLGAALASVGERVVVLDNLEQLVDAAPSLLPPLLASAPAARFVVTSRERLRVDGEICFALDPLALPPADDASFDEIAASDAVRLFVARAVAVRFGFELTRDDARAVAAIVQGLDGIPLAIELFAAGWPGERIAEHAAANRVHVTLTKLRKLGLAGLLQSRDDGFLLDASVVVVEAITGEPPLGPALKSCD